MAYFGTLSSFGIKEPLIFTSPEPVYFGTLSSFGIKEPGVLARSQLV